jgi:hypothetical protein
MNTVSLVAAGILLIVAVAASIARDSRRRRLAQFREDWGKPKARARKIELIEAAHRSRAAETGTTTLDDRTWDDLDLNLVFAEIDRTESTLGQQALYHRLRTAPVADHLDAFEALVNRMSDDPPSRERAQAALARLQDPHGYDLWWLARASTLETQSWYIVFPALAATDVLVLGCTLFWPFLWPALPGLLLLNVVVRTTTDGRIGRVARAFRQLAPVIATAEALRFIAEQPADHPIARSPHDPMAPSPQRPISSSHNADIGPCVNALGADVGRLKRLKTVARWVSGDPMMLSFSLSVIANIVTDVCNVAYEYLNLAFLLDANGVYFGVRDLHAHSAGILRVMSAIGEVDAAVSVASYRAGQAVWVRPRFRPPGTLTGLADVRHPLVADAVPNTITLQPGHGILVTGSNMSGKSTFLRTVGVAAVLAQTIHTCLASEYEAPVFAVRSCIGRADDLVAGKSYYIVEVEALLELLRASVNALPHLFLLDELFRGTNAVERIAAGQAVLGELLTQGSVAKPHVVLAATHDGELVDLLPDLFAAYHFGDEIGTGGLVFDHRLRRGPATSRNAIALLRLHGAPDALVARALACASDLDRQRGITMETR